MNAETPQTPQTPETPQIDLMTVIEVADTLRVSAAHVRRLVRTGALPAARIPGVTRIPRHAVDHLANPAA